MLGKSGLKMQNYTTEELKIELERRGYFTENLWQIWDVQTRFECSDEHAMEVLSKVLNNGYVIETIHKVIQDTCLDIGLDPI